MSLFRRGQSRAYLLKQFRRSVPLNSRCAGNVFVKQVSRIL